MKRLGWLIGLGVPAGVAAWVAAGSFLPLLSDPDHLEYVFLSRSWTMLAVCVAAAVAIVGVLRLNQRRFAPAILIASLDPLALLALVPSLAAIAGPLVFVAIDLRRWRWAAALLMIVYEFDRTAGRRWSAAVVGRWNALGPRARLFALDASLFAVAVYFACATTTLMRFTDQLHGDEPKYIRYAENLYQGQGFDITDIKPAAEYPATDSRLLANVRNAWDTIRLEAWRAGRDVRRYERDPEFVFNRGKFVEGWFVYSKTGRIFQVHTPGLSLLLEPFYYLDRRFLSDGETSYRGQFAGKLWATSSFFLGMYALWAVVIFRFVRRAIDSDWIAWLLAALSIVTIPIAAFAFQMYPETTAGVFLTAICLVLAFRRDPPRWLAAACGAMAGYLPWLHVRFLGDAGLLLVWGVIVLWRDRRSVIAFAAAWVVVMAALSLHVYHITGSIMPNALYASEGVPQPLTLLRIPTGMLGFVVDRGYGLLSYSPFFIVALGGVWSFARRQPLTSVFAAGLILAVAIPSAAHNWTAAGGSPLRHVLAVVPLLLLPMADALKRYGRSRAFRVVFAVLAVLAIQDAAAYNHLHFKAYGPMVDDSVSGWKINLLFPDLSTDQPRWLRSFARYLPDPVDSRVAVWWAYDQHGCTLCLSSARGRIAPDDLAALKPPPKR